MLGVAQTSGVNIEEITLLRQELSRFGSEVAKSLAASPGTNLGGEADATEDKARRFRHNG